MASYIHQRAAWPHFTWDEQTLAPALAIVYQKQGRLLGQIQALGFEVRSQAMLEAQVLEVIKTSEIEGEMLDAAQVRSSVARRLRLPEGGVVIQDTRIEGIVEITLDATQNHAEPLTELRLSTWHYALFPPESRPRFRVGAYRDDAKGPMRVVSGSAGRETVHFEAPGHERLRREMKSFLSWFNQNTLEPILKAGLAHLYFVTIHPFADGNGRIGRAIMDMQLAHADGQAQRFYSLSAQLYRERKTYYRMLEQTQCGGLDVTPWLGWFLDVLQVAINQAEESLAKALDKACFWQQLSTHDFNRRQRTMLNKLIDGFEGNLTAAKWAKICKVSHDTALRDIDKLIEQGVLRKAEAGGRSTHYELNPVS